MIGCPRVSSRIFGADGVGYLGLAAEARGDKRRSRGWKNKSDRLVSPVRDRFPRASSQFKVLTVIYIALTCHCPLSTPRLLFGGKCQSTK